MRDMKAAKLQKNYTKSALAVSLFSILALLLLFFGKIIGAAAPAVPAVPAAHVAHVAPAAPVGPAAPVAPVGPAAPAAPVGPVFV